MKPTSWYEFSNVAEVDSPALLIYPERAEENMAPHDLHRARPERLCPHVKTHKLAELVRMQMALRITKFKLRDDSRIRDGGQLGAPDVLLAYQPVGPKVQRFIQLIKQFPTTSFATIADDETAIRALSAAAVQAGVKIKVLRILIAGCIVAASRPGQKPSHFTT